MTNNQISFKGGKEAHSHLAFRDMHLPCIHENRLAQVGPHPPVTVLGGSDASGYSRGLELARELGKRLAKSRHPVITGWRGGMADAVREAAGPYGVLVEKNGKSTSEGVYTCVSTQLMHKHMLGSYSGAIVVLPGGFKTLDMAFEYITAVQIKAMNTVPVIFVDAGDGYWDGMRKWIIDFQVKRGMVHAHELLHVHFASGAKGALEAVEAVCVAPAPIADFDRMKFFASMYVEDISNGVELLKRFDSVPVATFLGSARVKPGSEVYEYVKDFARTLSSGGALIVSGGGSGIMNAAALGAGSSGLGFIPECLLHEGPSGNYSVVHSMTSRKELMIEYSVPRAVIAFAGGFGTLDEITEVAARAAHGEIHRPPIMLVGSEFWSGFRNWLDTPVKAGFVNEADAEMFKMEDSPKKLERAFYG